MTANWSKALLLILGITFSMGTLSSELVLFSPVSGVVSMDGKPLSGAKVTHWYKWKDEAFTQEIETDLNGKFAFKGVSKKSFFWSIFPHNPAIGQEIKISYGGETYTAWRFKKGDYELNSESNGTALFMACDLNKPEKVHSVTQLSDYFGLCELN